MDIQFSIKKILLNNSGVYFRLTRATLVPLNINQDRGVNLSSGLGHIRLKDILEEPVVLIKL